MKRSEGEQPRQTRIVATVGICRGDSWESYLAELSEAGVDVLRLNFSHASQNYETEREILQLANQKVPNGSAPKMAVLADLQGPKARIGSLPGDELSLKEDDLLALVATETGTLDSLDERLREHCAARGAHPVPLSSNLSAVTHRSLKELMGESPDQSPAVLFGDGELVAAVEEVDADAIWLRVVAGSSLGSRKGLTIRNIDLDLDAFDEKDQRDLEFCLDSGIDMLAVSFVRGAQDIVRVRQFVSDYAPTAADDLHIIAKIETLSAIANIDAILDVADGIMVARGDLGLQLGVEQVPFEQKRLVRRARARSKPVIIATQMLESMIHNPSPTRAEATDVFNAILDGGDAVMLSGETSIGDRPLEAVRTMSRIARKAETYRGHPEAIKRDRKEMRAYARASASDPFIGRINEEFALTAVQFAEHIPAFAVVSFTRSGGTPSRMSRYRPKVPLIAMCQNESVARSLLLRYGVHPIVMRAPAGEDPDYSNMIKQARRTLRSQYGLQAGDALVVTAGIGWPRGGTNVIRVVVEDLEAAREEAREKESAESSLSS